ncbi:MAG: dUTP diphosphatase [Clostridia bacterium]|nr:dUTP diphosphatase [Clostridia bacterium]
METVKIKVLNEKAVIPKYATVSSAGADLYALCDGDIKISPGETYVVHTGVSIEIPEGLAGFIFARSGLATKRGLAPANKVGVIDSDYRGEIMVTLHNHSGKEQIVSAGERIAQIVFMPYVAAEFVLSEELSDTVRGEGGFGSTGTK